jgi:phage protein D
MSNSNYVASPLLQIGGVDADPKLMNDILQISVEQSLHLPAMFTLVINNPYAPEDSDSKPWQYDQLLQIGQSVKIGFISSTTEAPEHNQPQQNFLIEGEITAIEAHFSTGHQAPIVVRGYDVSHRLHRGRYNRSFQNVTYSDVVQQIAGEAGITIGTIDPSGDPVDYIFQENQTNMEFLQEKIAYRIGFELFVQDGLLNFRKPKEGEALNLAWGDDIQSFRVRVTSAEQVSSVEVRSWDYNTKTAIVSKKQTDQVITTTEYQKGSSTSQQFGRTSQSPNTKTPNQKGGSTSGQTGRRSQPPNTKTPNQKGGSTSGQTGSSSQPPKMIVVDQPVLSNQQVFSSKQADEMAQALCNELGGQFVYADAQAPGEPRIQVGKVVNVTDMGKYTGKYYVTESRHVYSQGIYTTEFSVRGLRGGSILNTLSPPTRLKPGQTNLVGIVTDNKDPKGWGRVRVKFPTLNPETDSTGHESWWARVVGVGAGKDRGFHCLPEIDDEVLVAFEHGDIHRPYVIGGVWNGKDATPDTVDDTIATSARGKGGGQVRLRTIQTRTGHFLQFVEEAKPPSKAGIYITTSQGHEIQINDSDQLIAINTSGGPLPGGKPPRKKTPRKKPPGGHHSIEMNDKRKSITITSSGSISIDAPTSIDISSALGRVNISGANIALTAKTAINLTAPKINVSGVTTSTSPILVVPPVPPATAIPAK